MDASLHLETYSENFTSPAEYCDPWGYKNVCYFGKQPHKFNFKVVYLYSSVAPLFIKHLIFRKIAFII
jgi:hypothetical protein